VENPTAYLHEAVPLAQTLGMRAADLTPAAVTLELDWAPELCTSGGVLHGGALMALADSAGAVCAFLNLPDGSNGTSTIESKTNFVGAVTQGTVTASSSPLHVGRSTIVVETSIHDSDDRLVAKITQTQAVMWPRSEQ
jgi:1,4-dihydroxy-2-naphthoyl-CoA hydrolase